MQKHQILANKLFIVPLKFQFLIALLMAIYLNSATQYKSIFALLQQQNFYEAVAFTFLLALGVLFWIAFINNYLDRFASWHQKTVLRLTAQILLGMGLPILLIYLAVVLYFKAVGADIYLSDYLILEFPMVQIMVITLNVSYPFIPIVIKILKPKKKHHLKAMRGRKFFLFEFTDIAYLLREGKEGYLVNKKAETYHIHYKMNELVDLVPSEQFVQINRSLLVNLDVIAGYKTIKNAQCLLLLNISVPDNLNLVVTRDRTKTLKELLNQKKDEAVRLSQLGF